MLEGKHQAGGIFTRSTEGGADPHSLQCLHDRLVDSHRECPPHGHPD